MKAMVDNNYIETKWIVKQHKFSNFVRNLQMLKNSASRRKHFHSTVTLK